MANGISKYDPGKELSSLDFGNLIGGPLVAVVNAQILSAEATVDYIKSVGFDENNEPEYVTFNYPKEIVPYQPGTPSELRATVDGSGSNYNVAPYVIISGGGGQGAKARAVISNGEVTDIIITDQGFGYTSNPVAQITNPAGAGAKLKVDKVDSASGGIITEVSITNSGTIGYTHSPNFTVVDAGGSLTPSQDPEFELTFDSDGKLSDVLIVSGGLGFEVGDEIEFETLTGSGASAIVQLTTGNPLVPARYQDMEIKVPLLTLVPIPFISIEETNISFNAKINSIESHKTESEFNIAAQFGTESTKTTGGSQYQSRSSKKKRTRAYNRTYKTSSATRRTTFNVSASYKRKSASNVEINKTYTMDINVRAVQAETTVGMEKILGILENSIVSRPETS